MPSAMQKLQRRRNSSSWQVTKAIRNEKRIYEPVFDALVELSVVDMSSNGGGK